MKKKNYNIRVSSYFKLPKVQTELKGKQSIRFMGPQIWNLVPDHMKKIETLQHFKRLIKSWRINFSKDDACLTHEGTLGSVLFFACIASH